jgi:hypothetical protein
MNISLPAEMTARGRALKGHGYTWEIERFGVQCVLCEYDVHGNHHTLAEAPPTPYRLHARVQNGRCFFVDILDGQRPIWEHRTTDSVSVYNGMRVIQDSVIFGRRDAEGNENVVRVYHDGYVKEFISLESAREHMR